MLCLWVHWSHFCEENLDHFELVSRIRAAVLRLQQDGLKADRSKHHGMIWDIYLDVAQYHGIWYVVVCCDMLWHWNEHNSETGIEIVHIEFRWIHVWFWIQLDFELTFTWLRIVNWKLMWAELELELCFKHAFEINLICLWLDFGGSFIAVDLKSTFRISSTILNKLNLNVWVDLGLTLTLFKTKLCRSCIRKPTGNLFAIIISFGFWCGASKLNCNFVEALALEYELILLLGQVIVVDPKDEHWERLRQRDDWPAQPAIDFSRCTFISAYNDPLRGTSFAIESGGMNTVLYGPMGLCLFFVSKDVE